MHHNKIITNSALETKEYIKENEYTKDNNLGTFVFEIQICDYTSKYDVARI